MMELNSIPKSGTYADGVDRHNDNYAKINLELQTIKEREENAKGYYETLSTLETKFPSPKDGWQAYIADPASSTGYFVANVVNGAWVVTTAEAPAVGVNLAEYAKNEELENLATETTAKIENLVENTDSKIAQLAGNSITTLINTAKNGDFANGLDGWLEPSDNYIATTGGGIVKIMQTTKNERIPLSRALSDMPPDSIIYTKTRVRVKGPVSYVRISFASNHNTLIETPIENKWIEASGVQVTPSVVSRAGVSAVMKQDSAGRPLGDVGDYMEVDYFLQINLTGAFGSGKEPTAYEMDELLAVVGIDYFDKVELSQKQIIAWQSKLHKGVTNALIAKIGIENIVQGKGNSNSSVISQKVVTEELDIRPVLFSSKQNFDKDVEKVIKGTDFTPILNREPLGMFVTHAAKQIAIEMSYRHGDDGIFDIVATSAKKLDSAKVFVLGAAPVSLPSSLYDGKTIAWYDSSATHTINKDQNGVITRIDDKLGGGMDLVEGSCGWSITEGFTFDGVSQYMRSGQNQFSKPITVYMLVKQKAWSVNSRILDGYNVNTMPIRQAGNTPFIGAIDTVGSLTTSNLLMDEWNVVRAVYSKTAAKIQAGEYDIETGALGDAYPMGVTIGRAANLNSYYANVCVKQLIVRSGIDDNETYNEIYEYLKNRIGETYSQNEFERPFVSLSFDDGMLNTFENAYPYLKSKGLSATFYIVTNSVGNAGTMTWDNIREMSANGMDMQCHTHNHIDMPTLTEEQVYAQYDKVDEQYILNGLPAPRHTAYPRGLTNEEVQRWASVKRASGRGTQRNITNNQYTNRFNMNAALIPVDQAGIAELKKMIKTAYNYNRAINLYAHDTLNEYMDAFVEIVEYAQSLGMDIINISQLVERLSPLE